MTANDGALTALPGSSPDPGTGPAVVELFEGLLDDAALPPTTGGPAAAGAAAAGAAADGVGVDPDAVGEAVARHRAHRAAWYGDLVGPLVLPTGCAEPFSGALLSSDHALRVLLVADPPAGRQGLRAARDLLAEDERVEIVGVRLGLPAAPRPDLAMTGLLESLDFSAPAWIEIHPGAGPGLEGALDALAHDGAENLTLVLTATTEAAATASLIRRAVDLDLSWRLGGRGLAAVTTAQGPGWLNQLGAVRAALNGADVAELAAVLDGRNAAALTSAVRRMSTADAAVCRAFLVGVETVDVAAAVDRLVELGLVEPPGRD